MYDIRFTFEPNYDDKIRLYAYELCKNEEGEFELGTYPADSYYLSEEEAQQFARNIGEEDWYDILIDDWIETGNKQNFSYRHLPESVRDWIDNLPEYLLEDLSADTREMENA